MGKKSSDEEYFDSQEAKFSKALDSGDLDRAAKASIETLLEGGKDAPKEMLAAAQRAGRRTN